MKLSRRKFLHLAAALPRSRPSRASRGRKPIRRGRCAFPPGGGNDIMARLIGQWLSERLAQQFVIENRPGAGTNIATEVVINAPGRAADFFVRRFFAVIRAPTPSTACAGLRRGRPASPPRPLPRPGPAPAVPICWARARMMATPQLRSLAPVGFFFGGRMLRHR
jgi:hypothetical protein